MNFCNRRHQILALFLTLFLLVGVVGGAAAAPETARQEQSATAVVMAGSLNVRSGPGVAYQVVALARYGNGVVLLGRHESNGWAKIRVADGREGWVNGRYLQSSTPISSLPVIDVPANPIEGESPRAIVNSNALNVRSGPGTNYTLVETLSFGYYVSLLGRDNSSSWVKVRTPNGNQGWLNSAYTTMNVSRSSLPVVGVDAPAQPVHPIAPAPSPTAMVVTAVLNVRSGPGTGYGVITGVGYGQYVTMLGRDGYGAWVQVYTSSGYTGWVSAAYLQPSAAIASLPVVSGGGMGGVGSGYGNGMAVSNGLNVRYGPGTGYGLVTAVYYGTSLSLLGRNADGTWLQVRTPGGYVGWVYAPYVQTGLYIYNLPIV